MEPKYDFGYFKPAYWWIIYVCAFKPEGKTREDFVRENVPNRYLQEAWPNYKDIRVIMHELRDIEDLDWAFALTKAMYHPADGDSPVGDAPFLTTPEGSRTIKRLLAHMDTRRPAAKIAKDSPYEWMRGAMQEKLVDLHELNHEILRGAIEDSDWVKKSPVLHADDMKELLDHVYKFEKGRNRLLDRLNRSMQPTGLTERAQKVQKILLEIVNDMRVDLATTAIYYHERSTSDTQKYSPDHIGEDLAFCFVQDFIKTLQQAITKYGMKAPSEMGKIAASSQKQAPRHQRPLDNKAPLRKK